MALRLRDFMARLPWAPAPDWTDADARVLRCFTSSYTGQKLLATMRSEIAAANERAAFSKGNPFEAGWAVGYKAFFTWFDKLSAEGASAETDAQASDPFGAAGTLEHLAP